MNRQLDPYGTEERYTLDYLCMLALRRHPRVLRVWSGDLEAVKGVARRVGSAEVELEVRDWAIVEALAAQLGQVARTFSQRSEEVVTVCPWWSGDPLPVACGLVGSVRNALSYRSLRYPGEIRTVAPLLLARLRRSYQMDHVAGFLPPVSVGLLLARALAQRLHPRYGYFLEDLAMQRILTSGPAWRCSYVVLFSGRRREVGD